MRADTDWFRDAKWGVFFHYLANPPSSHDPVPIEVTEWNRQVDGFDVEGLAEQLAEIEAGYFFITLGQCSGYYLSPNRTYDSIVGRVPSWCSRRDLVADLYEALASKRIKLLVYLPAIAPWQDVEAVEKLKCTPPWDTKWTGHKDLYKYRVVEGADERLTEFQRNWEAVIREWSERWGRKVCGWWVDGCQWADRMYRHPDEPNFKSFAAALRAGNPDSILAFAPGTITPPVTSMTEYEDYTAGEMSSAFPMSFKHRPIGRWVDGAQLHILTFMGQYWCAAPPRFCDEFVVGLTKEINRLEGVVTWDVPPTIDGLIQAPFLAQLRALRDATRR